MRVEIIPTTGVDVTLTESAWLYENPHPEQGGAPFTVLDDVTGVYGEGETADEAWADYRQSIRFWRSRDET